MNTEHTIRPKRFLPFILLHPGRTAPKPHTHPTIPLFPLMTSRIHLQSSSCVQATNNPYQKITIIRNRKNVRAGTTKARQGKKERAEVKRERRASKTSKNRPNPTSRPADAGTKLFRLGQPASQPQCCPQRIKSQSPQGQPSRSNSKTGG